MARLAHLTTNAASRMLNVLTIFVIVEADSALMDNTANLLHLIAIRVRIKFILTKPVCSNK
jgi:hypothetical protein